MREPPFERRPMERGAAPRTTESLLGTVVKVKDAPQPGQVQVRLFGYDGVEGQDAPVWCRVAVAVAGASRGTFLLPDVGDEVLVTFAGGDSRMPIVIGSLWNGRDQATEEIGSRGVDRWSFQSKDGTRISVVEESQGSAVLRMEVPGGTSAELAQSGGGKLELRASGGTVTIDSSGVTVKTGSTISIKGTTIEMTASQVNVTAPVTSFSGIVQATSVQATAIVGQIYTVGAGNIW